MKRSIYIILLTILYVALPVDLQAQDRPSRREGGGGDGRGFSLAKLSQVQDPDSLDFSDTLALSNQVTALHVTPYVGQAFVAPMDTARLNFGQSTLGEGQGLAMGYLGNIGSPAQSRLFYERKENRDFIFADPFDNYIVTPENADFYDAKVPYTNILYTFGGGDQQKEERLKGVMTVNFGKKINIGGELDYIYSRGHYASNGNKMLSYRLFGSFLTDRYEARAYLSNYNFVSHENGGLSNDNWLYNPDEMNNSGRNITTKDYSVRYSNAFNRVRGKQYFLTHRFNLGFYRMLEMPAATTDDHAHDGHDHDDEGDFSDDPEEPRRQFVPVSSIVHTVFYEDNRRHFTSTEQAIIDTCYNLPARISSPFADLSGKDNPNNMPFYDSSEALHDRPSYWKVRNTFALSLREGFQNWVKFGLSAFVSFEQRKFRMSNIPSYMDFNDNNTYRFTSDFSDFRQHNSQTHSEFSTYVGGELSKSRGSVLTYNARGEICVVGDDLGEFRLSGDVQTRFKLFKKEAYIKAEGYVKNLTPAFYTRHYLSRYYRWNNNFRNERQVYAGGSIHIEKTGTTLFGGVNNVENHVYFGSEGVPVQHDGNLQVITGRIKQDLKFKGFGWENEAAYQLSSNKEVLPLPEWSLYTNMYVYFKLAKVLTIQLGADAHYFTSYYAPYYEPATQQFQLQANDDRKTKIGDYPLINAYLNFHLKQTRFFIMGYNVGTMFLDPKHFSYAHYPLNPFVLKFGISVMFNN
ncbi:putative porin [Parabacteroides sp. OttesenSCG-928-G06]|nr:putative porin [Parabacteroides sp. OttesenSCG-928-K15]MDL2282289.1 putative porin [Parabacteroides sp. OttesenSCG-928-G06]